MVMSIMVPALAKDEMDCVIFSPQASDIGIGWGAQNGQNKGLFIGSNVKEIGVYAFAICDKLVSVEIGDGISEISWHAFYLCTSLKNVSIGSNVNRIGYYAFSGCESLTSIVIPDNVTAIGEYVFEGCNSRESITLPFVGYSKDATSAYFSDIFGNGGYGKNSSLVPETLKTVVITGGTSIGSHAFYYCKNITSITLPKSITSIGKNAFNLCEKLTDISGLVNVESIGDNAFQSCYVLEKITLSSVTKSIGNNAFDKCYRLADVYYIGSEAEWSAMTVGQNNENLTGATVHYNHPNEE